MNRRTHRPITATLCRSLTVSMTSVINNVHFVHSVRNKQKSWQFNCGPSGCFIVMKFLAVRLTFIFCSFVINQIRRWRRRWRTASVCQRPNWPLTRWRRWGPTRRGRRWRRWSTPSTAPTCVHSAATFCAPWRPSAPRPTSSTNSKW